MRVRVPVSALTLLACAICAPIALGSPGGGGVAMPASTETGGLGVADGAYSFPLDAPHTYGDGFGAGRNHEGQDVFARCGTPILAAHDGTVQRVAVQRSAGNYIVIDGRATKVDAIYAHMRRPSPLARGDRVMAGDLIGAIGRSGNASACHLHFEIWSAPGWYEGGRPLASVGHLMRSWDIAG